MTKPSDPTVKLRKTELTISKPPLGDIPAVPILSGSSRLSGSYRDNASTSVDSSSSGIGSTSPFPPSSQPGPSSTGATDINPPQFHSALDYTEVHDYAYPEFHPLHYGVPLQQDSITSSRAIEDNSPFEDDDGPPWQEDPDLQSPRITSRASGDRLSRDFEFSIASADEIHGRAVALFDFTPENENEAPLREGQIIWVSYRHGQGWLVAEDPETGETGLVPEEYVQILSSKQELDLDAGHPSSLDSIDGPLVAPVICESPEADSEGWVDEDLVTGVENTNIS